LSWRDQWRKKSESPAATPKPSPSPSSKAHETPLRSPTASPRTPGMVAPLPPTSAQLRWKAATPSPTRTSASAPHSEANSPTALATPATAAPPSTGVTAAAAVPSHPPPQPVVVDSEEALRAQLPATFGKTTTPSTEAAAPVPAPAKGTAAVPTATRAGPTVSDASLNRLFAQQLRASIMQGVLIPPPPTQPTKAAPDTSLPPSQRPTPTSTPPALPSAQPSDGPPAGVVVLPELDISGRPLNLGVCKDLPPLHPRLLY